MSSLYKRGNVWWAKIYKDGKPEYYSLKTSNKQEAKKLLDKKDLELKSLIIFL